MKKRKNDEYVEAASSSKSSSNQIQNLPPRMAQSNAPTLVRPSICCDSARYLQCSANNSSLQFFILLSLLLTRETADCLNP